MAENIILIVGLGNPGREYEKTRHNIGFICVDQISNHLRFPAFYKKFDAVLADKAIKEKKIFILKPQTYMNLSGISVRKIVDYYKISVENVIVIHDEIDLKIGDVRVKRGGGNAGHNGLKSLDSYIGKDYLRIRIGVDKPAVKEEVADYVLSNFSKEQQVVIDEIVHAVASNIDLLFENNEQEFLSKIKG